MELIINFDKSSEVPLFKQFSEAIKQSIIDGTLKPGQMLPSVRELSAQYSISKTTVMRCYEELSSQGYIQTAPKAGTFVSKQLPGIVASQGPTAPGASSVASSSQGGTSHSAAWQGAGPSFGERSAMHTADAHEPIDSLLSPLAERIRALGWRMSSEVELSSELNLGMPAPDDLPLNAWRKVLYSRCSDLEHSSMLYSGDPFGSLPLREAIADYLQRVRAIKCGAEMVMITAGSQQALDLVCRLLLKEDDHVVIENPGYPGARRTLLAHGARLCPVSVDGSGVKTAVLADVPVDTRLIYVTPAHQDPTGGLLSLDRRRALLAWAAARSALVFEDDYDHELRYGTDPLPSLFSLDSHQSVFYVGTFYRTLGPLARLGYIIVPRRFIELFRQAASMLCRDLPVLEQAALASFMQQGHYEVHIRRFRNRLTGRRQALIHELTIGLRGRTRISTQSSGMHVICQFSPEISRDGIVQSGKNAELQLKSTEPYYLGAARENEFLVPFAHLSEEDLTGRVRLFIENLCESDG